MIGSASASRIIGDGEMAGLIRGFDWSRTPLGTMETWPDILVTTVNMLLASRHPMFLWWGPELIQFYNDGYRPSIRSDKHPAAVGQRGMECWPEIWPIIGPQIAAVMSRGESTWNTNQLVPINRNGKLEEVYWTYSYSPVRDKEGAVRGTLVVCSETTEQVLSERRLRTLLGITAGAEALNELAEEQALARFAQAMVRNLSSDPADIPFAALYLFSAGQLVLAESTSPTAKFAEPGQWPWANAMDAQGPSLVEDLQLRDVEMIREPWPEPVTRAYVLPLPLAGSSIRAVLVFGISPLLPFDERYQTFFQVIGARVAAFLQAEVHQLELAEAAKRFSSLVEANPFGMVIGGLDAELRYVNPAFLKTLGYSEAEVRAGRMRWDELSAPEYADADARAAQQLREFGRCEVYEKVFITKDQRRIPVLIGASAISTAGNEAEVAVFVTDLSALKSAEAALRNANDELEKKVTERTAALEAEVLDRKRAETSLRELSGRLLVAQDEERRHMARELHDHAGQTLALLTMNLAGLERVAGEQNPQIAKVAAECRRLSEDLSREIRTLSYLLHPPLLDEMGLASALRWYVEGFSERSKIMVDLDLSPEMDRLPRELELVIFRVVQESLTNVHRHSGSSSARIHLRRTESAVEFQVSDGGKGISTLRQAEMGSAKTGVGVRGMEERVRQFGGTLRIDSSATGRLLP
ncbi:MAG: PAS domain S-box protein [Candidatus Acidiferrales bacterium]